MPVTYQKISYPLIEKGLKSIIDDEFPNVYVAPRFKLVGNECIRINLTNSEDLMTTSSFEEREYQVMIRYYFQSDLTNELVNESIKAKIDRLKRHLIDNHVKDTATSKWVGLLINNIEYDIQDEENEENDNLYIAEFELTLINHNPFGDE